MKTFLIVAWISSYSVDGGTTFYSLNHGGHEQNPLMSQNAKINLAELGVEAATGVLLIDKFYARHPKLTKTLAIVGLAVDGYCAGNNSYSYLRYRVFK